MCAAELQPFHVTIPPKFDQSFGTSNSKNLVQVAWAIFLLADSAPDELKMGRCTPTCQASKSMPQSLPEPHPRRSSRLGCRLRLGSSTCVLHFGSFPRLLLTQLAPSSAVSDQCHWAFSTVFSVLGRRAGCLRRSQIGKRTQNPWECRNDENRNYKLFLFLEMQKMGR